MMIKGLKITSSFLQGTILRVAVLLFFYSCSSPYDFESQSEDIMVIDAIISTMRNASRVEIYQNQNDQRDFVNEATVVVVNENDNEFVFIFSASEAAFVPESMTFRPTIGDKYKIVIEDSEGFIYESPYDSIVSTIPFEVESQDTTISRLVSGSILNSGAVAGIAEISPSDEQFFAKFEFQYKYRDFFTSDTLVQVIEDEYALINCGDQNDCESILKVPVGFRINQPWFFYNDDPACPITSNCEFPCCFRQEIWEVDYVITAQFFTYSSFMFWEEVQRINSSDGLIFDTFPFAIKGNIRCTNGDKQVVGFFRTVSEVQERKTLSI